MSCPNIDTADALTLGKLLLDYQGLLGIETRELEKFDEESGRYVSCYAFVHKRYQVFGSAHSRFRSLASHAAREEALLELVKTIKLMDGGMVDRKGDLDLEMRKRMNAEVEDLEAFRKEENDEKEYFETRL